MKKTNHSEKACKKQKMDTQQRFRRLRNRLLDSLQELDDLEKLATQPAPEKPRDRQKPQTDRQFFKSLQPGEWGKPPSLIKKKKVQKTTVQK
jgi:hypothetical protein